MLYLSRSLHDYTTQDTDKPEIQPISEPESLHSFVQYIFVLYTLREEPYR